MLDGVPQRPDHPLTADLAVPQRFDGDGYDSSAPLCSASRTAVAGTHLGQWRSRFPCHPDLFARPTARPLDVNDVVSGLCARGRTNLDQSLQGKAARPQLTDPLTVRRMELDSVVGAELRAVALEIVAHEGSAGLVTVFRRTRGHHCARREEDQHAVGLEKAMRFRQPATWVGPETRAVFRNGQVEAIPVERNTFGVRLDEPERQAVLLLQPLRGGKLEWREVDSDRTESRAHEPSTERSRSAAELDDVRSRGKLGQKS